MVKRTYVAWYLPSALISCLITLYHVHQTPGPLALYLFLKYSRLLPALRLLFFLFPLPENFPPRYSYAWLLLITHVSKNSLCHPRQVLLCSCFLFLAAFFSCLKFGLHVNFCLPPLEYYLHEGRNLCGLSQYPIYSKKFLLYIRDLITIW